MKDEDIWTELLAKNDPDPHAGDDPDKTTVGDCPPFARCAPEDGMPLYPGVPAFVIEVRIPLTPPPKPSVWPLVILLVAMMFCVAAAVVNVAVGNWWLVPVNLGSFAVCCMALSLRRSVNKARKNQFRG